MTDVRKLTEKVDPDQLMGHMESIAQWIRLSGTEDERKAFDYIERQLRLWGYDIQRYTSEAMISYPGTSSLSVTSHDDMQLVCNGYSFSPSTGEAGIEAELIYIGAGNFEDIATANVAGKILLSDGLAMPGKALLAQQAGAVGHIHINDEHIHEMCISPIWGTPVPENAALLPAVPAIAVDQSAGDKLKILIQQGSLTVRLVTEPFMEWGELPTLIADLPGQETDHYVLFSGHVDSWHYGAMDNASANATQLEVGRLLAEHRDHLHRGIRLAFWSGHSHSRYAGSTWYADTFWHDIHERCECHVNVDSVGAIGATVLEDAPTMAETHGFAADIMREVLGVELSYQRISRSSDQSFWGHGIPSVFAALSQQPMSDSPTSTAMADLLGGGKKGGGLGWWWHTTEDTIDKVDRTNLARDAKVYVATLARLCMNERLPFNFARTAREITNALSEYDSHSGDSIDLGYLVEIAESLERRVTAASLSNRSADIENETNRQLSRILIPINFTMNGPFDHDPALGTQPLPGLSYASDIGMLDSENIFFRFARTKLVRECNRVEHALREAHRVIDGL